MATHIYCSVCTSQGKQNRCYITGYDIRCAHDNGWAYTNTSPPTQTSNGQCSTCSTDLGGPWSMESNPSNVSYQASRTGRYLGVTNGYFLYHGSPNWVYSYCRGCWVKELHKFAPSIGLTSNEQWQNEKAQLQQELKAKVDLVSKTETEKIQLQKEMREKIEKIENEKGQLHKEMREKIEKIENEKGQLQLEVSTKSELVVKTQNEKLLLQKEMKEKVEKVESENGQLQLELRQSIEQLQRLEQTLPQLVVSNAESGELRLSVNLFPHIEKKQLESLGTLLKLDSQSNEVSETVSQILASATSSLHDEVTTLGSKKVQQTRRKIQEQIQLVENNLNKQVSDTRKQIDQMKTQLQSLSIPASIIEVSLSPLLQFVEKKEEQKEELTKMKKVLKFDNE